MPNLQAKAVTTGDLFACSVRHVRANPFLHEIDSVLSIHQFIAIH